MDKGMQDIKKQIGLRIKEAREKKGWSYYKLAKEIHLSTGTPIKEDAIKSIENASKNYTIDALIKVSSELDADVFSEGLCE